MSGERQAGQGAADSGAVATPYVYTDTNDSQMNDKPAHRLDRRRPVFGPWRFLLPALFDGEVAQPLSIKTAQIAIA